MNNKGQVLVSFIIILPIILILFTLVVDLGLLYVDKRNISNNVKDAVEYYLKNKEDLNVEENTKKLLNKNISDIEININNNEEFVEITVIKKQNRLSIVSNNDEITITYKGIKDTNKIIKG